MSDINIRIGGDNSDYRRVLLDSERLTATSFKAMGQTVAQIGNVSTSVEKLRSLFMLGGLLTSMKAFFSSAIEHARDYQGEVDGAVEATKRFGDTMDRLKVTGAKAGVEIIGWVEKAGFGLASLVYGVDAASDAYNEMDAAARKALDDERTQKLTTAKEQLAKIIRDISFSEAGYNGKLVILLNEQSDLRAKIRDVGAETVEGQKLLGELVQSEHQVRKLNAEISKEEAKSAAEKAAAEKKASAELETQKKARDELIAKIQKETIEIEAKVAAETAATIKAANAAAGRQGFEKLSKAEEAALKDWIAGGKKGPPPITRDGALRDSIGLGGQNESSFLVDGRWYPGRARPASDFNGVSEAALREFIRRREADAASLRDNFGTGATALVDVVSGGAVRGLAGSVIGQEIDLARRRLGDIDLFSGKDRTTALRDFKGDPLAFDRLYESSQRTLDATTRTALGVERLVERIQRPQPVIVTNSADLRGLGGTAL